MTSGVRSVIAGMYVAIDTDDFSALAELFQPHAIYERPAAPPLVGRDAILHFYRHGRKILSGRHVVEHIVVENDAGAAWGSFAGRRVEGWTLELCFGDCFTFEGGLIQTRRSHVYLALPA
jgi:ketosteroid isomerase-like protein